MQNTSIIEAPALTLASGVTIPDSRIAREVTEMVRDTENSLLFNHSSRTYYFAAATGKRKGLTFDPELLYECMFHDMVSLETQQRTDRLVTRQAQFLRQHKIPSKTSTPLDFDCPSHHPGSSVHVIRWLRC